MTLYAFTDKKVLTVREQIQEDLITLLDSQFGEVDYLDNVKDLACQIVIDNFTNLTKYGVEETNPMTLSKAQFNQLIENYANHVIEGLDNVSMEVMLFDLLTREYETYTEEQIVNEIEDLYGEEVATDLLESVAVADEVSVS